MSAVEPTGVADFDAIMWGWKWDVTDMTFSFPTSASQYPGYASIQGFEAFNAQQQTAARQIMAEISSFTNLNITFNSNPNAVSHFRFGEADMIDYGQGARKPGGGSAEGNPPDPTHVGDFAWGDTWYTRLNYDSPIAGNFSYAAGLMHEVGHALGLAHGMSLQTINHPGHSHQKPVLPTDHNSQEYSVMTYRTFKGDGPPEPGQNFTLLDYPQSYMLNDIAALQIMYGADFSFNSGATTYAWNASTGQMSINGVTQGAVVPGNLVFRTIWDGGGVDTYSFTNYTTNLVVNLNPGEWTTTSQAQLAFLGRNSSNVEQFARGNIANAYMFPNDVRSLIENANGGSGNDSMTGNLVANRLDGHTGADHMRGLAGNDTYVVDNAGDVVDESIAGSFGIDTVRSSISFSLANTARVLGLVENLILTGTAANGTGNGLDNDLTGNASANVLNGGAGADTMVGFGGDDTLIGGAGADRLDGGSGVDTVTYTGSTAVVASLQTGTASGGHAAGDILVGVENLTGSSQADTLTGNSGANILNDGGGAADTLQGLGGNDTYRIANSGAIVKETAGQGTLDTVISSVDYVLKAGVEVELLRTDLLTGTAGIDLTGNALKQTIMGNAGINILNDGGGAGIDTLQGLGGNDTYRVGNSAAVIVETAGQGTLDVVMASVDYVLKAGVAVELLRTDLLAGTAAIDLTGNALKQTIMGNAGANILNDGGGAGVDTLQGLGGNDTYRIANSAAIVKETTSEGTQDTVMASVDYVLKAGVAVEVLRTDLIAGTTGVDLTGNEVAQAVMGNAGSNILDGKGGNDKLTGFGGKDFFVFSSALGGGNVDTVTDFNIVDDIIRLENAVFTKLAAVGTLVATLFRASSAGTAADANDFVLYDTDDGKLFYDADGSGGGGRFHFATLTGAPAVTAGDFVVV